MTEPDESSGPVIPLCVIGDSMVAGIGDSTGRGWTARLVDRARERGERLHVTGLGIRGDTSTMIADRWDEVDRRIDAWPGTAVIAQFGANDALHRGGVRRVSEAGTLEALRRMAERAPAGRFLVLGPAALAWEDVNARLVRLSAAIGTECERLGVPFVPVVERLRDDAG